MVQEIENGKTTLYLGNYFEISNPSDAQNEM
jgi:hypothetical protein